MPKIAIGGCCSGDCGKGDCSFGDRVVAGAIDFTKTLLCW